MISRLISLVRHFELTFIGALPSTVRRSMYTELGVAVLYGVFYAAPFPFMPVVLRRLGASSDCLIKIGGA